MARLKWSCRRGMLELDLIFDQFLQKGLPLLDTHQLNQFRELLTCTDPELFAWLMGHDESYPLELAAIVAFVRTHS